MSRKAYLISLLAGLMADCAENTENKIKATSEQIARVIRKKGFEIPGIM